MIDRLALLLLLMGAAHVVCDFPLQPAALSIAKRAGGDPALPWPMALLGHALVHGGAVALITGSPWLGAAETAAHAAVDFGKSRGAFGVKTDQAAHAACKLVWALIASHAISETPRWALIAVGALS